MKEEKEIKKRLLIRLREIKSKLNMELQGLAEEIDDRDDATVGGVIEHHQILTGLAKCDTMELKQIAQALDRIEEGTYGICEICEKKIPQTRLEVLPYANLCVKCQQKRDEKNAFQDQQDAKS